MANYFMHGAYSELGESAISVGKDVGTVLAVLTTAPVHLIRREKDSEGNLLSFKDSGLVDNFIEMKDSTAKYTIGISKDWTTYKSGEVLKAAFENSGGNVAPVYVMNIFNPDEHKKGTATTKTLAFVNNKCDFESDSIILDTLALSRTDGDETADLVEDVDYKLEYNMDTNKVIIRGTDNDAPITGNVAASFYEVDTTALTTEESITAMIKGSLSSDGESTGLVALRKLFTEQNKVANILIAPGFTHINAVYNSMVAAMAGLNDKFYGVVMADIPTSEISARNTSRAKAIAWKKENGRNSERAMSCYPCVYDSEGNVYHLSTVKAMKQLEVDQTHNSIPYESTDNKQIPMFVGMCMADGTKIPAYTESEANELNAAGITTVNKWTGNLYLWGNATDAYAYGADYDLRARFDVNMRMLYHLMNRFILNHHADIGDPMKLSLKADIENEEQEYLDYLVAEGALIGEPKFSFIAQKNAAGDIVEGNFRWDVQATPTVPLNSVKLVVSYTTDGFSVYYE